MFKIGPTSIEIASVNLNFEEQKIDVIYYMQTEGEDRILMSKHVPLSVLDSILPLEALKDKFESSLREKILSVLRIM